MPGYKKIFSDQQRWALINYIRTLAKTPKRNNTAGSISIKNPKYGFYEIRERLRIQTMVFTLVFSISGNIAKAQQPSVDSALMDRVSTLEQQVADQKPGESHFMVVGLATFGFVQSKTTYTPIGGTSQSVKTNSLGDADRYELSPMLLWRHGTKFLVEFEPSFDGNSLGVNWANITYFAAPGLAIHAGYFVLPFGIYNKRLAAGWIDKVAPDPVGVDLPGTDFGIGVSGGWMP